jgi:putative chitinase
MRIHYSDLAAIFPQSPKKILEDTVDPINACLRRYDITTVTRASAFIAQVGHECGGFVHMAENLNYSADGLRRIFPRYFPTVDLANAYARNPQKIANRVYASRMGNGPESSGDGWRYRGRGYLQLSGKYNYELFAKAIENNLSDTISYLETREGAAMSAGWFWNAHRLNVFADQGNFKLITQRINGGQIGAEDREKKYLIAKKVLS